MAVANLQTHTLAHLVPEFFIPLPHLMAFSNSVRYSRTRRFPNTHKMARVSCFVATTKLDPCSPWLNASACFVPFLSIALSLHPSIVIHSHTHSRTCHSRFSCTHINIFTSASPASVDGVFVVAFLFITHMYFLNNSFRCKQTPPNVHVLHSYWLSSPISSHAIASVFSSCFIFV